MKKRIPIGIDDFDNLIRENYYFADKSLFIKAIMEAEDAKIILLPRPRRFGKSLNMSMMKYFLTNKNAEKNRELFKGLLIEKESTMEKQGKYPVLYISFKDVKTLDWENCYNKTINLIAEKYRENQDLIDKLDLFEKEKFMNIALIKATQSGLSTLFCTTFIRSYLQDDILPESCIPKCCEYVYNCTIKHNFSTLYSTLLRF